MWRVFGGAVLVIAGIAAFIEAHSHVPANLPRRGVAREVLIEAGEVPGWSQSTYDLVRIGGWALVIIGALLIIVGLIAYSRRPAEPGF